jgi:hypothetical protein
MRADRFVSSAEEPVATLTIDLPETLLDELHRRHISDAHVRRLVIHALETWLHTESNSVAGDTPRLDEQQALARMEQAARDPQFLADLYQTMNDFAAVDTEWCEPAELTSTPWPTSCGVRQNNSASNAPYAGRAVRGV